MSQLNHPLHTADAGLWTPDHPRYIREALNGTKNTLLHVAPWVLSTSYSAHVGHFMLAKLERNFLLEYLNI